MIDESQRQRLLDAFNAGLENAQGPARGWDPPRKPPFASAECRLPPMERERNPAAAELYALLVDDAVDALVSACADSGVRDAVARLLEALARAR